MKYRPVLVMLLTVIVAALVAYALSRRPTSEEMADRQRRILPGLRADRIAAVEIETGERRIVCQRDAAEGERWLITAPLAVRADRWEVEGIIDRFETAETMLKPIHPTGDRPLDLSEFGLDRPRRKVTFREAAPSTRAWTLLIGNETGAGKRAYAAVPGKDLVHRIEKSLADRLDVTLNELRSKKLCPQISAQELTGVKVSAAGWGEAGGFRLACARKDGAWELREPFLDLADGGAVEALAEEINGHVLAVGDFIVDDPAQAGEYGLDEPVLSLTFELGDKTRSILLGRTKDAEQERFYAMNEGEPAIVKVPKRLFEDLRKGPDDLRARSLLDFEAGDVEKLVLTGSRSSLTLERADDGWWLAGEKPAAADDVTVDALLDGLRTLEVQRFVEDRPEGLEPYGLDEARLWDVALMGANEALLGRLHLGSDVGDGEFAHVRRPDYVPVLSVKRAGPIADLKRGRLALLDRLVLEEPAGRAVALSLAYGEKSFRCERADSGGDWKLVAPVRSLADQEAVGSVLSVFAALRCLGFATESAEDIATYGLDEPRLELAVTYRKPQAEGEEAKEAEPPAYEKRLLVGAESKEDPRGFFAGLDGDPRVFVLGKALVDRLKISPASKLICRAYAIERLALTWEGNARTLLFDKEQKLWKDAGGGELDDQLRTKVRAAARLLERFTGVKVAAYSMTDPTLYGFDRPALRIELKDRMSEGKTVVIGKKAEGGGRYVKGAASRFVLLASGADAEALLALPRALEGAPP